MKAVGGLFDQIHPLPRLVEAAWRASKGKRQRRVVRQFWEQHERILAEAGQRIRMGTFEFSGYTSFAIRDPKTRIIRAPSFVDRVVHHAIIGATAHVFERGAIDASFACRLGKGQHGALALARRGVRGHQGFLKLDIARYYDSVPHDLLRRELARRFRERRLLRLFDRLLDSYSSWPDSDPAQIRPHVGLPIGALTSQYLGNFFLDPTDHWAQSQPEVRGYLRYMDDMLFFGDVRALAGVRRRALGEFEARGLRVKDGGVLGRCEHGVPWLGFTLYPSGIRLNRQSRARLRRKLRSLERAASAGAIEIEELQSRGTSLLAHAVHADDRSWRRRMLCSMSLSGPSDEGLSPRLARRSTGSSRSGGSAPEGEMQELGPSRDPRWCVEQLGEELPVRVPQQEASLESQRQSGISGLSAPRNGGAWTPPDDASSRAPHVSACGDEALASAPAGAEICAPADSCESGMRAEKDPAEAPPRVKARRRARSGTRELFGD